MASRQTYYAFGVPRTTEGTLPTDYTFTGQHADNSAGLMYYGARYYDAAIGRFTQPDSIIPDQFNPQSLNRYAYVDNNPLNYTDPSGHGKIKDFVCKVLSMDCGGGGGGGGGGGIDPPKGSGGWNQPGGGPHGTNQFDGPIEFRLDAGAPNQLNGTVGGTPSTSTSGVSGNANAVSGTVSPLDFGNQVHYDELNGGTGQHLPTELQNRYPETEFRFARRGQRGPDATYQSGPHPSEYPDSNWPSGFDHGDFKPNSSSGANTFYKELKNGKLPGDTVYLPYDTQTGHLLKEDYVLPYPTPD